MDLTYLNRARIFLQWYFENHRLAAQHDPLRPTLANKKESSTMPSAMIPSPHHECPREDVADREDGRYFACVLLASPTCAWHCSNQCICCPGEDHRNGPTLMCESAPVDHLAGHKSLHQAPSRLSASADEAETLQPSSDRLAMYGTFLIVDPFRSLVCGLARRLRLNLLCEVVVRLLSNDEVSAIVRFSHLYQT